jgi:hypothetical protein
MLSHCAADDEVRRLFGENARAVLLSEGFENRCTIRLFSANPDRAVNATHWPRFTDISGPTWEAALEAAKKKHLHPERV